MTESLLSGDASLAMFEATRQGVLITVTATRTLVYANPAACAMFGYAKSELEGTTIARLHPPATLGILKDVFDQKSTVRLPPSRRLACLRQDRTEFVAEVTGARVVIDGQHCTVGFFTDVTQRIKSEQALQRTQEIASKVFNTSPSAIGITRLSDGVFLDVNPGFAEWTGYTRDELVGRTALPEDLGIWVSQEDRRRLVAAIEANHGTASLDARFRRKDGQFIYGVMHARVMLLDEEQCLLTITNDISDIRAAEDALFAEKERLAVTLQSIGDAVVTTDTAGRVVLMNKVAEELTEWRPEEALGRPLATVFQIVDEQTNLPLENPAARVLASGKMVALGEHAVLIGRHGQRRVIADSGAPIKDASGNILGVVLVFRDTTERRRAERLVHQSEEKFRTIIEQNADGFCLADEFGTVIEYNPALERISGVPREKVIGHPVWETMLHWSTDAEGKQRAMEGVRALFMGGISRTDSPLFARNREVVIERNGEELTLHQTLFPIQTERGFRVGAIIRDVTEQKKLAAALQRTEKLESLGVLAGGIAHDFNNLLGGIYGNIELAYAEVRDPELAKYLKTSLETMDRARALTHQLLTFAKGGAPVRRVESLFPFVRTAVEFALSGSNVNCQFEVASDLWQASYDKHQLAQVIDNLVINAMQAMPQGGRLSISAVNVVVGEHDPPSVPPGSYVRISFRDQGPGIPKPIAARIFDPFFTTKEGGTGLGLATSHSIVRQHGGHISCESEPGRGSTFHVLLPGSQTATRESLRSSPGALGGSGTVLLMDDDDGVRDITQRLLERLGYRCRAVDNGQAALEAYRRFVAEGGSWRAIICDLTVREGMSGDALAAEIRKVDAETPIIVTSGYAEDPILADPKRYGFNDSLPKPYTASELGQVLAWNPGSNGAA